VPLPLRPARARAALVALVVLLGTAPAAPACDPQVDSLGPRAKVYLFDYAGAEEGEARNRHSQFQAAMLDKAERWSEELSTLGVGTDYLGQLQVIRAGRDSLAGRPDQVRKFWSDSHALQLLSGIVDSDASGYSVRSRIFLGELRGGLASSSIVVGMPVVASQFGNVLDSHSIVTYYALAIDARRRRCDPAVAIALLNSLAEKVADLRRRNAPMDPALESLARVAEATLDELAGTR
jgi:hypothetical protein